MFFILGTIFGSFYNVVGSRLPKGESIVTPPSHCNNCNHKLSPLELIPVVSFLIQRGKCRNCGIKLSVIYPLYAIFSGVLFALAFYSFGFSLDLIIAITFISCILIIIASDIEYMIISDEVLIFFAILLIIELLFIKGLKTTLFSLLSGVACFIIMYLIKKFGDYIFKKESMGGGDIKLLFIFGLVIGVYNSILAIFLGSIIGLPISLIILKFKKTNIIPFGPFLGIGAIIVLLLHIDLNMIMNLI